MLSTLLLQPGNGKSSPANWRQLWRKKPVLCEIGDQPKTMKETWQANGNFLYYDRLPKKAEYSPFQRQGGQLQLFSLRAQCLLLQGCVAHQPFTRLLPTVSDKGQTAIPSLGPPLA